MSDVVKNKSTRRLSFISIPIYTAEYVMYEEQVFLLHFVFHSVVLKPLSCPITAYIL